MEAGFPKLVKLGSLGWCFIRLFFKGGKTERNCVHNISIVVRVQVLQRVCGKIVASAIHLSKLSVRLFFLFFDGSFEVSDVFFADVFFPFAYAVDYLAEVVFEFFIC